MKLFHPFEKNFAATKAQFTWIHDKDAFKWGNWKYFWLMLLVNLWV